MAALTAVMAWRMCMAILFLVMTSDLISIQEGATISHRHSSAPMYASSPTRGNCGDQSEETCNYRSEYGLICSDLFLGVQRGALAVPHPQHEKVKHSLRT
jgi:hypothetical protein